jgi:hypothetical protein
MALSINLLEFAHWQFKSTYIYQNQDKLKEICEAGDGSLITPETMKDFLLNSLTDDIKISICFENLLKALLLSNYYLIHELDPNILSESRKIQKKRPIMFTEFLQHAEWKVDQKIKSDHPHIKNRIRGIKNTTLSYSFILNQEEYKSVHNMKQEIIDLLNVINRRRNELHLQSSLQFKISNRAYLDFKTLDEFLEKNVTRIQDDISKHLGISKKDRAPTMKFSRS